MNEIFSPYQVTKATQELIMFSSDTKAIVEVIPMRSSHLWSFPTVLSISQASFDLILVGIF
jgi:hypothetical protein